MEERTLELTVISAQGLKKVSTFGHETCYAVAYISSSEKKATKVDRDGGVNPTWNAKLTLTCDDKLLRKGGSYITVDIYSFGTFSNKLVGTSKISLVDVGKQAVGESRAMAFEVRRPSMKVKGVLNVSVRVGESRTVNKKNHSGQAFAAYSPADPKKRPQQENGAPLGYPQTYSSWSSESTTPYPLPKVEGYATGGAVPVYPPPKTNTDSGAANNAGAVYPPPKPSGTSSTDGTGSKKQEEPVMAYPVYPQYDQQYGYGQQYGPQSYGSQYAAGSQQYYYPAQGSYGYQQGYQQQVQYSKPSRWQGSSSSSGAGLGLLGGVLGGLLLGDVIGDIF